MLSLCQKSGKLVSGEESCEKAIRANLARVIIVAENASENTKKKFKNSSQYYKVPIYFFTDNKFISCFSISSTNAESLAIGLPFLGVDACPPLERAIILILPCPFSKVPIMAKLPVTPAMGDSTIIPPSSIRS